MSKAEDRAFEKYPDYRAMDGGYVTQTKKRKVFTEGYHQAEKDLELTWKDIQLIWNIFDEIANDDAMEERLETMSEEEYYQEVLKRFKEKRENT